MTKNFKLVETKKLNTVYDINRKNILNKLFGYEKKYEFTFDGAFDMNDTQGSFIIKKYFRGINVHYRIDCGNRSFSSKGFKLAMMGAIEYLMVGHIKYTNLKYKVREGVFNGQF